MNLNTTLKFLNLIQKDLTDDQKLEALKEILTVSEQRKLELRFDIIKLHNQAKTQRYISGQLGCSNTTVNAVVSDWKNSEILKKLVFI